MGKCLKFTAFVCLAVALTGCFTFEHAACAPSGAAGGIRGSRGETLSEHAVISNYGWYLFNTWPLVCGNAREGAVFPWAFFRDDVDENVLQNRLTKYVSARGGNAVELTMFSNDQIFLDVYSIPIPYICCFRELQLSCAVTPRAGTADAPSEKLRRDMDDLLRELPAEGGAK